jgi:hypothetical protein
MPDIKKLLDEKANAAIQLADCQQKLATEEEMLSSLRSKPQTAENEQYLESSKNAYRAGIKAWKLSIIAWQGDIDRCQAEIDSLLAPPK